MAARFSDTGIELVRSEADDQVWVPVGEGVTAGDAAQCAGRQRAARDATIKVLMDPNGYEYRWVKVDDKRQRLEERETADNAA